MLLIRGGGLDLDQMTSGNRGRRPRLGEQRSPLLRGYGRSAGDVAFLLQVFVAVDLAARIALFQHVETGGAAFQPPGTPPREPERNIQATSATIKIRATSQKIT